MRRLWAAGAAIVLWLAVGGSPALAQEATESTTPVAATESEAVHVSGSLSNWAGTWPVPGSVGDAKTSDARLDGCYVLQQASWRPDGPAWGTLKVFDRCGWVWPTEDSVAMWEGGWFAADHGPASPSLFSDELGVVWLAGLGENEGRSASVRIGDGILDAWLFPTPETITVPMPGQPR